MAASLLSPDVAIFKLEKAGLKQHQIATLLGIAQGTVSKIKSKRYTEVSYKIVDKLRELVSQLCAEETKKEKTAND
jgi:Helix-turn-helix.